MIEEQIKETNILLQELINTLKSTTKPIISESEHKEIKSSSIENVRNSFIELAEKKGRTIAKELLETYEAKKIPELDPKYYDEILFKIESILGVPHD